MKDAFLFGAGRGASRDAYRMAGKSIGFSHQCAELPECKRVRPDLADVPSQVLQDALKRVALAFDAFFRRCENGEKPGYPRCTSRFRYDSMTFKQYGNSFSIEVSEKKRRGTLVLAKLGQVKMVMHRPLQGTRDFGRCQAHSNRQSALFPDRRKESRKSSTKAGQSSEKITKTKEAEQTCRASSRAHEEPPQERCPSGSTQAGQAAWLDRRRGSGGAQSDQEPEAVEKHRGCRVVAVL